MKTMEFLKSKTARIGMVMAGTLALVACSQQSDPPTPNQFNNDAEIFILKGFTAANGEPVRCVMYGTDGYQRSWFDVECDFEGTAYFPGEDYTVSTTTTSLYGG